MSRINFKSLERLNDGTIGYVVRTGQSLDLHGQAFALDHRKGPGIEGEWVITELSTGLMLCHAGNKKDVLEKAERMVEDESGRWAIGELITRYGGESNWNKSCSSAGTAP